jgi:cobalamin biosynthesis protein CobD/CbiB
MSFINQISSAFKEATSDFDTFGTIIVGVIALTLLCTLVLCGSAVTIWVLNTLFALVLPFTWQTLLASALLNVKISYVGSSSVEKLLKAK